MNIDYIINTVHKTYIVHSKGAVALGITERKKREQAAKKRQIIDAAVKLFVNEGMDNVSIRKIAKVIEYSPAALYLYFESKAALVEEMMTVINEQFLAYLNEAVERHKAEPVATGLSEGLLAYIKFGLDHPDYYRLLFMQETHTPVRAEDTEHYKGYRILSDLVAQAVDTRFFKPLEPRIVTASIWASIHGLVSLVITKRNFEWGDLDAIVGFHVDSLLQSFRA